MESERHIDQAALQDVLQKILPSLQGVLGKDDYRLVGTAAALLHGCEVPVEDIDFLARRRSHVDAFAAASRSRPILVLLLGGRDLCGSEYGGGECYI